MSKYLDENGLLYYDGKVKARLNNKVDKVAGKTLTSNDYITEDKNKLTGIEAGAQVNVIEEISINGTEATITGKKASVTIEAGKIDLIKVNNVDQAITNKTVNISVPTKVSDLNNDSNFATVSQIPTNNNQLTNGAGYQTSSEVQTAINNAIKDITSFEFVIVTTLPTTGNKGVIYLVPNTGTSPNAYDEYIWLGSEKKYEKIGSTDINLSNYWSKTELVTITNEEIDNITK